MGARLFMAAQALIGLAVLLQFNLFAVIVGAASLAVVAVYPFMKRITYWPQIVLGFAFNWGALLGWAAVTGALHWSAFTLYFAGIAWTLAYDTIYALQDKLDDAIVGIKSTALKFGDSNRFTIGLFHGLALVGIAAAGLLAGLGGVFLVALAPAAAHAAWQIYRLDVDQPDVCLMLFRANRDYGVLIFLAILAETAAEKL
jgi:4-hydroxybenzoate polyprenyltransferase